MKKKIIEKLYTEKNWYINTFNALGSSWLISSLKEINPPPNFRFASFSANSGYYENAAFKELKKEYTPTFYLNDLSAQSLKNGHVQSGDNFIYMDKQCDAREISIEKLDNKKLDIILDCKGALWYAFKFGCCNKTEVVQLLRKYRELLNDSGVLLIDFYDQKLIDTIIYELSRNNNSEKKINQFGEKSTKNYLRSFFGKKFIEESCEKLKIEADSRYPLSNKMGTAIISVESIDLMIDILNSSRYLSYRFGIRRALKRILDILLVIEKVIIVIVVLIIIAQVMWLSFF